MASFSLVVRWVAPRYYLALALVAALTLVAYGGVFENGFLHWDDRAYISANPHIQRLSLANLKWMLLEQYMNNWHPLTWLSHALDYVLWGDNPGPHHVTSLLLHLANTLLVFYLAILIQPLAGQEGGAGSPLPDRVLLPALLAAALFALHPQHVESVAWLAERKDVLYAFLYLLAMIAYLRNGGAVQGKGRDSIPLLLFLLALMAKSMAISLPIVLILLDIYPLRRLRIGRGWLGNLVFLTKEKALFFFLAAAVATIALITQDVIPAAEGDTRLRFLNALNSLFFYLHKWLVPLDLSPFYPYPDGVRELNLLSLGQLLAFIVLTLFCVRQTFRGNLYWLAGWLYYLVTLFPVIGLIKVGEQAAADRYGYLPLVVFYIGAGVVLAGVMRRLETQPVLRFAVAAAILLYGGGLAVLTARQVPVWQSDKSVWNTVNRLYPGKAVVAYLNLGNVHYEEGDLEGAVTAYRTGLGLAPRSFDLHRNLSLAYEKQGRVDLALAQSLNLIRLHPETPRAYLDVGEIHLRHGRADLAEGHYREALRLDPSSAEIHYRLGRLYLEQGRMVEAKGMLLEAARLAPDHLDAQLSLGVLHHLSHEIEPARAYYQRVLTLDPGNAAALNNLKVLGSAGEGRSE